eukprot:768351-Hanusia_phi.AAC.1
MTEVQREAVGARAEADCISNQGNQSESEVPYNVYDRRKRMEGSGNDISPTSISLEVLVVDRCEFGVSGGSSNAERSGLPSTNTDSLKQKEGIISSWKRKISSPNLFRRSSLLFGGLTSVEESMKATFLAEWKEEFKEMNYQPTAILLFTYITVPSCGVFYFITVSNLSKEGFADWKYIPGSIYLVSAVICFTLAVLFTFKKYRLYCARNHEGLITLYLAQYFLIIILPPFLTEIGNVIFEWRNGVVAFNSTTADGKFQRICTELDPVKAKIFSANVKPSGCDSRIIDGRQMGLYLNVFLELIVFHLHWRRTLMLCVYMVVFLVVAVLSSGSYVLSLITSAIFFLVAGISSSFFCFVRHENEKQTFAIAKRTRFASEQSRNLVNTLMPENVLSRIAPLKSKEFVGVTIPRCTIMFCSLAPQDVIQKESSQKIFHFLDSVFETFDSEVQHYGMYKYQHVGDWYIITCPRAAAPFDEVEQSKSYPSEYGSRMVMLAKSLMDIAAQQRIGSTQLSLKVGISYGSVAGAVIGMHRAFYCVYGDTTNTAARMCKHSEGSQILCTKEFAELMHTSPMLDAICRSEGTIDVKGKGPMEVFSVHVNMSPDQIVEASRSASISGISSLSSLSPSVVGVNMDHLSAQSKALLKSDQYKIDRLWCKFTDASSEEMFLNQTLRTHRLKLSIGIALHLCAIILQFHLVVFPVYSYNFDALGAPELEVDKHVVFLTLTIHLILSGLTSAGLWLGLTSQRSLIVSQWIFVIMKLVFLSVSVYANKHLAPLTWTLFFPFFFVVAQSNSCGIQVAQALVVTVVSTVTYLVWIFSKSSRKDLLQNFLILLLTGFVSFIVVRLTDYSERFRWRMHQVFNIESTRLREILSDLMPSNVADDMMSNSMKQPCQQELAVVLELDLCNFTRLSQGMDPMELANMIHRVFSKFDLIVQDKGLFKMDTVGDAYIVSGWLPQGVDWMRKKETKEVCHAVLDLARSMLSIVQEQKLGEEQKLSCRIGISVGMVTSGILGKIQSRFHIIGQALKEAEQLEHDALVNSVHVCDNLLQILALDSVSEDQAAPADSGRDVADGKKAMTVGGSLRNLFEHLKHKKEEKEEAQAQSSCQFSRCPSRIHVRINDVVRPNGWDLIETRDFKPPPSGEEQEGNLTETLKLLQPSTRSHVLKPQATEEDHVRRELLQEQQVTTHGL